MQKSRDVEGTNENIWGRWLSSNLSGKMATSNDVTYGNSIMETTLQSNEQTNQQMDGKTNRNKEILFIHSFSNIYVHTLYHICYVPLVGSSPGLTTLGRN